MNARPAFGSLLASAIENMNGIRGYFGWRWIFILEGIATCIFAIAAFFLILDFPESATWLSEEEVVFMRSRLVKAEDPEPETLTLKDTVGLFKKSHVFLGGLMYFGK